MVGLTVRELMLVVGTTDRKYEKIYDPIIRGNILRAGGIGRNKTANGHT